MKDKFYKKTWVKVVGVIIILAILGKIFGENKPATAETETKADETPSLQMAEIKAKRYLKESLKDPDSYEVISAETAFIREYKGDTTQHKYIQSGIKYRAKNSFGGYVIERRNVIMNADFTPLEIYEIE